MHIKQYTAALLVSTLLAGCMVGPHYHEPAANAPDKWLSATSPENAQAVSEQNWWEHFGDPVLSQLISKALAGNLDLKIEEARIAEARATRASARADLLPTVNTDANAERQGNRLAFGNAPFDLSKPFNTFQAGFDASWELDLFGGKRHEIEADAAELKAAEATRDDVRISLLAEVARTYMDIREYQAQLAIIDKTLAADQQTLDIANQRFKAGTSPGLEVTQASAQMDQAKSDIPHTQSLLTQAEYSMDVLLGEKPGSAHALLAEAKPIPVPDKNLVLAAPAQVIANRPDIKVAERKLAAATAQQGIATAAFFPDISLSGFLGLLNTDAGNLLRTDSKSWDIGGNLLWPILNFSKLSAGLDAANARQQEAFLTYRKSVIAALADVERSLTAYTKQQEEKELLDKTAEENRHAVDIAQMRYKEGLSSFIEVLDAERTLYASESKSSNTDAAAAQNLIAVYKSLGGGWKNKDTGPAIK